MNSARLQAHPFQCVLGQFSVKGGNEFGKTVFSQAAYHPVAFPDDASLKGHSVVENPMGALENPHTVIWHLLIQAEIDRFNHSLEIVSGNGSMW